MPSDINHLNLYYWSTHQTARTHARTNTPKCSYLGPGVQNIGRNGAATTTCVRLQLVFLVTRCGIGCVSPAGVENFDVAPGFWEKVFNILHICRDPCHLPKDTHTHTHNQGVRQTEECIRCILTCVKLNLVQWTPVLIRQ